MSTLLNAEMYDGDRVPTVAGLFQDEVTDTNSESRKSALSAIQLTSRTAEVGVCSELPMFMLKVDVSEQMPSAPPKVQQEFDLIRL